jgi:hypothetical protein
MRSTGLLLSLALGSGLVACSGEADTKTTADTGSADSGCNLFTGEGCEDSGTTDTGSTDTGTGGSDTGATDTGATDTGATDTGGATNPRAESQALLSFCAGANSATKPNVIVILVDDMGFSDLGCYGS